MATPKTSPKVGKAGPAAGPRRPSALVDARIISCGDRLEQLPKLPDARADLAYIVPLLDCNRNYAVLWGETKRVRAFEDRNAGMQAYIDHMGPRCVGQARTLPHQPVGIAQ